MKTTNCKTCKKSEKRRLRTSFVTAENIQWASYGTVTYPPAKTTTLHAYLSFGRFESLCGRA